MPTFPDPPAARVLVDLGPAVRVVPSGSLLWRIYRRGGRYPTRWNEFRAFGPLPTARFDHHPEPQGTHPQRVAYVAEHGPTCLAEAFQDRVIDRLRDVPYLVGFRLVREISLLDLSGNWLTAAGASQEINSGPRDVARRWSRAIHGAYAGIEGLWYPSKMAGGRFNLALYERAESALAPRPETDAALGDPALDAVIRNAARDFGYLVV